MNEFTNSQATNEENKADSQAPPTSSAASEGRKTPNFGGQSVPFETIYPAGSREHMLSGARWFYWIAGLSLINSIVATFDGGWSFLAGLGITQVISGLGIGLAHDIGGAAHVIALSLDTFVAAFFVFLGVFASKGHTWAFIVGVVVYVLDGLLFLVMQDWLPLAFHAFVVYGLVRGLLANQKLKEFEAEEKARLASVAA